MADDPDAAGLESRCPKRQWLMQLRIRQQGEIGAEENWRIRRNGPVRLAHPTGSALALQKLPPIRDAGQQRRLLQVRESRVEMPAFLAAFRLRAIRTLDLRDRPPDPLGRHQAGGSGEVIHFRPAFGPAEHSQFIVASLK